MNTEALWLVLASLGAFGAVATMVYGLIQFFSKGWQSYEERYVAGATRTLDSMYLTMTAQQIIYLSLAALLLGFSVIAIAVGNIGAAVVVGIAAFPAPYITVQVLKKRRDRRFGEQLVDALVAMGNGLRAGHSLPSTLEMIAKEMDNPMGQEMRLVTQEMRLGVNMDDALQHLLRRMPNEDLDVLITSISISREVGGNLAEVFDNIADTIRDRHRIQGKIRSLTAQGKLQGAVVGMLPLLIGIGLNAVSPELMKPMFEKPLGLALMGVICVMLILGWLWIRKIVTIKI